MDGASNRSAVEVLASLLGTWQGRGTVWLPSMEPREFTEVVRFSTRSPSSLDYWQRATDTVDGSMLHSEVGIWRVAGPGSFEVTVALPGATEVSEGEPLGNTIVMSSTMIGRAAMGAGLVAVSRRYDLRGDEISYAIGIGTETFTAPGHIKGILRRTPDD